jgi:FtsH-binding integral membrane protein
MTYSDFNARRAAGGMAAGAQVDAGLRAYMQRVYSYMAGGLALTGIVTYAGFYQSIAGTPLIWIVMLAPLGFVFAFGFGIQRMSAATATLLFGQDRKAIAPPVSRPIDAVGETIL